MLSPSLFSVKILIQKLTSKDKGKLEVSVKEEVKKILEPGASFGDIALLYNCKRESTIRSLTKCELFGINRNQYKAMVTEIQNKEFFNNRKMVKESKFFIPFTQAQRNIISGVLLSLYFSKGDIISSKGDSGT